MTVRGRPDHFVSSVTKPDDFDAFWEQVQSELDEIPPDPELRMTRNEIRASLPHIAVFPEDDDLFTLNSQVIQPARNRWSSRRCAGCLRRTGISLRSSSRPNGQQ